MAKVMRRRRFFCGKQFPEGCSLQEPQTGEEVRARDEHAFRLSDCNVDGAASRTRLLPENVIGYLDDNAGGRGAQAAVLIWRGNEQIRADLTCPRFGCGGKVRMVEWEPDAETQL